MTDLQQRQRDQIILATREVSDRWTVGPLLDSGSFVMSESVDSFTTHDVVVTPGDSFSFSAVIHFDNPADEFEYTITTVDQFINYLRGDEVDENCIINVR